MKANIKKQLLEKPYRKTINKRKYTGAYMEAEKLMIDRNIYLRAIIYIDGEAEHIILCDRSENDWCTYVIKKDYWTKAMLVNLPAIQYRYYLAEIKYINTKSQTVGQSYFNDVYGTAQCIREWQINQKRYKARERFENEERRTRELMEQVGELPEDFTEFAEKKAFTDFRYLYYESVGKKDIHYFCSCCRAEGITVRPQGKEQLINKTMRCPHCRKKVTIKSMNRAPYETNYRLVTYIQRISDGLMARTFKVYKRYTPDYKKGPEYNCYEIQRIHIDKKINHYKERPVYSKYYGTRKAEWRKTERNQYGYWYTYIYTTNLKRKLKGTRYQYCALTEYARHFGKIILEEFINRYIRYPILESIIKIGLWNLAYETVNSSYRINLIYGKNKITEALGIKRCDIPTLKELNPTFAELEAWKKIKENRWKDAENEIHAIREISMKNKYIRDDITQRFESACKYTRPTKLIAYMKQQKSNEDILRDWLDYIEAAGKLGYNLQDTAILFPKNFKAMHDRTMELIKIEENKIHEEAMAEQYKKNAKKYQYQSGDYLIKLPQKPTDLIREGKKLSHCVGTYISRVAEGDCIILLIREAVNPQKPFYTAEIRNNVLIQLRGKNNCSATEEVKAFWEEYKTKVLNKLAHKQILREAV